MLKLAVLISGRGSNMEALAQACAGPGFPAKIAVVISNRPQAVGLQKAERMGLSTAALDHKAFDGREAFDKAVEEVLLGHGADLVCLAGFDRIFSAPFAERWTGRIVNIHPSLLPLFPGLGLKVHAQALASGMCVSGCSVHWVTPELDAGPIIGQSVVPILPGDTEESLAARVLPAEHALYVHCVRMIAEGRVRFENGRTRFADAQVPAAFAGTKSLIG